MSQISQLYKQAAEEGADKVRGLRVFRVRLITDDGWYFFTAKDIAQARSFAAITKDVNASKVSAATLSDLTTIAARALEGV